MPISFSILANRSNKHIIMIHMTVITNMSIPSVCAILNTNMERKDVLQPIFYHVVYLVYLYPPRCAYIDQNYDKKNKIVCHYLCRLV